MRSGTVSPYDLTTAHASTAPKYPVGMRGVIDPVHALKNVLMASGGFKEYADAKLFGYFDVWEVVYVKAYSGVTAGTLVKSNELKLAATAAGTTTTVVSTNLSGYAANTLKNGLVHKVNDAAAAVDEGTLGRITANTTGVLTFTPAHTAISVANDDFAIVVPYSVMTAIADDPAIGIALATLTAGQYGFVLQKGLYLTAPFTAGAYADGAALTSHTAGVFTVRNADTEPLCGYLYGDSDTDGTATTHPVYVHCDRRF
uniref:Uncharacterized protein n=1 Tax=viral metagenome TaxID=1070528 RepID=A0A6M3JX33_9ZZZZ